MGSGWLFSQAVSSLCGTECGCIACARRATQRCLSLRQPLTTAATCRAARPQDTPWHACTTARMSAQRRPPRSAPAPTRDRPAARPRHSLHALLPVQRLGGGAVLAADFARQVAPLVRRPLGIVQRRGCLVGVADVPRGNQAAPVGHHIIEQGDIGGGQPRLLLDAASTQVGGQAEGGQDRKRGA